MSAEDFRRVAIKHGTDKCAGHSYAGPYALHLDCLREREFCLLEIAIGGYDDPQAGGASLRAWKEYFPRAQIVGLDYYDKSAHEESRIKIYKGSQADPVAISKIIQDFPNGFDVVIDDGSHRSEHILASMIMLWQYVNPNGYYVVEDLQTSYWPNHGGSISDRHSEFSSVGFLKSRVDGLNWQEQHNPTYQPNQFDLTITEIHFYHNIAFLKKWENSEGSTELKNNRINGI